MTQTPAPGGSRRTQAPRKAPPAPPKVVKKAPETPAETLDAGKDVLYTPLVDDRVAEAPAETPEQATQPAVAAVEPVSTPPAPPVAPETLESGSAVLLANGGEAVLLAVDLPWAYVRVGTAHNQPLRVAADSLTAVDPADETRLHVKFRREALKRGEI